MQGLAYSAPTRFRNVPTVFSPQYVAARSAVMLRGQEPAGMIAGWVMASRLVTDAQRSTNARERPTGWLWANMRGLALGSWAWLIYHQNTTRT